MKATAVILRLTIFGLLLLPPILQGEADDRQELPRVLLIGDSISIGYTDMVRSLLEGTAIVERIPGNGGSTNRGLAMADSWTAGQRWDVIHFNFGIHDAKLPPEGEGYSPLDVYADNLRGIVSELRATGAQLIWASSTPIPFGGYFRPNRRFADITEYNRVALDVMREEGVRVNDLYAAIEPCAGEFYKPRDLHFTEAGYSLLAKQVADAIRDTLAGRRQPAHP